MILRRSFYWDSKQAIWFWSLLAAVPLLWPRIPPLLDLPSHMASYYLALNLSDAPDLRRFFAFRWELIGNLGADLLIMPLAALFGVEIATKLLAIIVAVLTALGFLLLAREVHGRLPATALAAVPLAYNYPFILGFINYSLSTAVAFLAFALWIRWSSPEFHRRRALLFILLAAVVWVAHAIGWVILVAVCTTYEFHKRVASPRSVLRAFMQTLVSSLPLLSPILLMPIAAHGPELTASEWLVPVQLAKFAASLLRDRWLWFDLASAALLAGLIGLAAIRITRLRIDMRLGWPALTLLGLYILAPQAINGSQYVSARIIPYAAALALLALNSSALPEAQKRFLTRASVLFLLVRLTANTASFAMYDALYSRHLQALRFIPRGSRVVSLSSVPCWSGLDHWYNARVHHLPGLAIIRNHAFVNTTWSINGLQMLRVHYPDAGGYQSDPSQLVFVGDCPNTYAGHLEPALREIPYAAFDRIWLLDIPRTDWPKNPRFRLVWSTEDAALYEVQRR